MKTDTQIQRKLQQVLYRHLQKRLRAAFRHAPRTCVHNELFVVDGGGAIGLCRYTSEGVPTNLVCDAQVDDGVRARECPYWEPREDKETLKAEFQEILDTGDRGRIALMFPDAAALMWALDDPELALSPEQILALQEELGPDVEIPGWDWGRWPWAKKKAKA